MTAATETKPKIIIAADGEVPSAISTDGSLIVATCRVCLEERPAHVSGMCLDCRLGRALAPHFDRLVELLRKQRRYAAKGLKLDAASSASGKADQVGKTLRRMFLVVKDMVPQRDRQLEYMNRAISRAEKLLV